MKTYFDLIVESDALNDPLSIVNLVMLAWDNNFGYSKTWKYGGNTYLKLSTGGWSENESIISALHICKFHTFYWDTERSGGQYIYVIQKKNEI